MYAQQDYSVWEDTEQAEREMWDAASRTVPNQPSLVLSGQFVAHLVTSCTVRTWRTITRTGSEQQ